MKRIDVVNVRRSPPSDFDWVAYYVGEADRNQFGYGSTRERAVCDLVANYPESVPEPQYVTGLTSAVAAHALVALAVFVALAFSSGAISRYVEIALAP